MIPPEDRIKEITDFLKNVDQDPDVLLVVEFLKHCGAALPLILGNSVERISNPKSSMESKTTSYLEAAKSYVVFRRYFQGEKDEGVIIMDSSRQQIYPLK